ncbi:endonuclease domain-containing protein [Streptomyces prasinus]|uniref:endonuclease domain-containing protein n=1 Tax=Streptomyces prasinus TaxID=67345 RepID=UPI001F0A72CC|nr:endonuclease domain-containing protein [Streptomyces prasinus]
MPDGLRAYCRECSAEHRRQRREAKGRKVRGKVPVPSGHKRCPRCEAVKPHTEWERDGSSSDGRTVGLLPRPPGGAEPDRLLRALVRARSRGAGRGGRGAARSPSHPPCRPAAHVDHRHRTGRVRGVLCFSCNAVLGQFEDRPDAIRRAAAYVEGIAWKPTLVAPGVCRLPS